MVDSAAPVRVRRQDRGAKSQGAGRMPAQPARAGPKRAPPPARRTYAALDLGTNNCRLLIARPEDPRFIVVDAFSRIVRLGEGLAQSGAISTAAMDRALSALSVCAEKLVRRNVYMARSVATEACRRAANGAEFVDRVYRETGIKLDIISAQEEARLAVLGCHVLLEEGDSPALVFDIGGGSTELVLVDTAGRLQTKHNLMEELSKVRRIVDKLAPEAVVESLLVLDASQGQNGLRQAMAFAKAAGLTGVVLTKLDGSSRGGVALAVASEAGLPIRFIGAGEGIRDLRPFNSFEFVEALLAK